MNKRKRKREIKSTEIEHVRFNRVEGVDFFATPDNQIFVKYKGQVVVPQMSGQTMRAGSGGATLPAKAFATLVQLMRKQSEVRRRIAEEERLDQIAESMM